MNNKEEKIKGFRIFSYGRERDTYSLEVKLLFLVHCSIAILCIISLIGTFLLNKYPDAQILWILGIIYSLINMEICLNEKYYKYSKMISPVVFTFLFLPLGLIISGSIITPSVLYAFFALMIVNLIVMGKMRIFYSSSIILIVIAYTIHELGVNNFNETILVTRGVYVLWIFFFTVISILLTILMCVIFRNLKKYNEIINEKNIELYSDSIRDGLTTLYNKRHFDQYIVQVFNNNKRADDSVALIMLDIDDFKLYNDHYGHLEGDLCLKIIADVLKRALEGITDKIFRIGGEEFAILLQSVNENDIKKISDRIHEELSKEKLEHLHSEHSKCVTLSIGALVIKDNKDYTIKEAVKKADMALYESKKKGKNCYTIYSC